MSELASELCQEIDCAVEILRSFRRGVALTGAGISTPSGIPDFRSPGSGLWTRYDPFGVASLSAFRYQPERFFAWFRSLALVMWRAEPNPAHFALARLEAAGFIQSIVTQNIDGLHQRAGARRVLEVHGSLQTLTCIGCYQQFEAHGFIEPYIEHGEIPHCPDCTSILKPNAVLFEEQLPAKTWMQAQLACRNCDLILVTGSSLEVMPVAGLPLQAIESGARLILINQSPTYLDVRADVVLRGDVAQVLPRIAEQVSRD
jgi:NAD-dependent deacetylase